MTIHGGVLIEVIRFFYPWFYFSEKRNFFFNIVILTLKLSANMCDTTNPTTQSIADYLSQLLKDRKQLAAFPNVFIHVERLLDEGELLVNLCIIFY